MSGTNSCARALRSLFSLFLFLAISQSSFLMILASDLEFNYDESSPLGPQHWGDLNAAWSTCKDGQTQSPVDINDIDGFHPPMASLAVNYRRSPALLQNKGHDIMVNWTSGAGYLVIGGEWYMLRQCHWHSPSEHTVYGLRYPLEMHTVYTTSTGKIAVIGVLYKLGYQYDPFINYLVKPLKQMIETHEKEIYLGNVGSDEIDRRSSYFRYRGSLTTPPCTEGVTWTLMEEVKTVSPSQLDLLREAMHNMSNARPVQPINGRKIDLFKQGRQEMVMES